MLRIFSPIRQGICLPYKTHKRVFSKVETTPLHVSTSIGLASGVLGSLCGVGGGAVILPALRQFSTLGPKQISATSLFCVSISAFIGGGSYIEQGFANLPLSSLLIATSVIPTFLGSFAMAKIPSRHLLKITAFIMFSSGPAIWMRASRAKGKPMPNLEELSNNNRFRGYEDIRSITVDNCYSFAQAHPDFAVLGMVSGFLSGMIGIGGGLIMNSYMALFTDMPQHEIIATSLVTIVPIGLAGTVVNLVNGYVQFRTGFLMALTGAVGMGVTSRYAKDIDDVALKKIFAVAVSTMSVRFLI